MNTSKLLLSVLAFMLFTAIAKAEEEPRQHIVMKERAGTTKILRSMPFIPVQANIDYATEQINVEFYYSMPNCNISIIDEAGNTIATQNADMQTQVSIPIPQQTGYYYIVVDVNGREYEGEFYIISLTEIQ